MLTLRSQAGTARQQYVGNGLGVTALINSCSASCENEAAHCMVEPALNAFSAISMKDGGMMSLLW